VGESAAYRATAIVDQRFVSTDWADPKDPNRTSRPTVSDVRRQILSEGNLRRAALGLTTPACDSDDDLAKLVAQIRARLTVEVSQPSRNRLRIAITAAGRETEFILQLVNDLARQYAAENHTKREATARQHYREVKSAAGGAGQDMEKAEMRLQAYMEKHYASSRQRAEVTISAGPSHMAPTAGPQDETTLSQPSPPGKIEDPEWLGLRESLARARQHYEQLAHWERQAWLEYLEVPEITHELASRAEIVDSAANHSRLMLLAFTSAVAAAVGVGMIWLGFKPGGTFSSLSTVESSLPVVALGKVPIRDRDSKRSERVAGRWAGSRAVLVSGWVLILACLVIVARAVASPG
jgi:hypothetical protein